MVYAENIFAQKILTSLPATPPKQNKIYLRRCFNWRAIMPISNRQNLKRMV